MVCLVDDVFVSEEVAFWEETGLLLDAAALELVGAEDVAFELVAAAFELVEAAFELVDDADDVVFEAELEVWISPKIVPPCVSQAFKLLVLYQPIPVEWQFDVAICPDAVQYLLHVTYSLVSKSLTSLPLWIFAIMLPHIFLAELATATFSGVS